ncbi:GerAB/ArcD/ProY family transporter [Filibacter tadaridae]|uniref:Spore germination protein n=1 Tax=Filibacter tadaridae TaxID=2483811 RepID=A0A3P5WLZ6_9BACL|nr:GerAB/ArcD/ProY family transporter [Filibacter tadaridae]VDC22575.1 Spore germination protein [Filibacter tadaridae]
MNRFFYYLILVNLITNIITPVPRILLQESKNGAVTSLIIAFIVGLFLTYVVATFFNKFPGKGLPELLKEYTPKWFSYPTLFYMSIMWYVAGLLTLITFTFLLLRYLTPQMSIYIVLTSFLLIAAYGVLMKTRSVLDSTEIILFLFIPIIVFLLIEAYRSPELNWDFVKVAMMHVNHLPGYNAFTASLYAFIGVANLVIFNRNFSMKQKFGLKQLMLIGATGAFILFTTYFIPIGFIGFDSIKDIIYPWISTTDSIRMRLGVIERVIYLFLISFLAIALASVIIHWHIAVQLFGSIIHIKRLNWKEKNLTHYLFVIIFLIVGVKLTTYLTEYQLIRYSIFFFNTLPILYALLLISMVAVKRGAKS